MLIMMMVSPYNAATNPTLCYSVQPYSVVQDLCAVATQISVVKKR
jgi:hypothetical protein